MNKDANNSIPGRGDSVYGDKIAGDKALGDKVGGDKITQHTYNYYAGLQWDVHSPQNVQVRRDLIANMRLSWIDEKSLQETIHIELGLAYDARKLDRPMQLWEGQPDRRGDVPVGKPISEVFGESGRSLLVLGDPGSGKSYTLAQLARQLLETVAPENTEPIPVILNLSSWAAKKPDFIEWLVEQIFLQYGIGKKVTPALLQANHLCLLLDGLDEVEEDARNDCVKIINRFRGDTHLPLVVCSRIKDYETLTIQLQLTNAVVIQPLSDRQIKGYLTHRRLQLDAVYEAVEQDDALKELAQTPLFLSIMAVAYKGYSLADLRPLPDDVEQRQRQLYQMYIRRVFGRPREGANSYPTHQALAYLAYLAQQLARRDRSLFFFEDLQPEWLPPLAARRFRFLSVLCIGLVVGLGFGLVGGRGFGLVGGLIFGLLFGLIVGLSFGLDDAITPVEELSLHKPTRTDLKRDSVLVRGLGGGLVGGGVFGLVGGLVGGLLFGLGGGLGFVFSFGLAGGLLFGLGGGLVGLLLAILRPSPSRTRSEPGEGIGRSGRNALGVGLGIGLGGGLGIGLGGGLAFALVVGLDVGLLFGLGVGLIGGLILGPSSGLSGGLLYGGSTYIRHYLLRWQLQRENLLPFRLQPFLDAMAGRIILQRTGPSYRFIHRTLQEYFAGMTKAEMAQLKWMVRKDQSES